MKKLPVKQVEKLSAAPAVQVFRRAVGLFPEPQHESTRQVKDTTFLRFHHMLVGLEGAGKTGCLKIISNKLKSRAGILLYKGRVVGCVYGRKNLSYQYLEEDAHKHALSDLALPGNILDAYELPEDLVLAAASLFYGQSLNIERTPNAEKMFEEASSTLITSGLPGCVVVTTLDNQTLCVVYICSGRVLGIHSVEHGWMYASRDSVSQLIKQKGFVKILSSIMPLSPGQDAGGIGFSLTGLADRQYLPVPQLSLAAYDDPSAINNSLVHLQLPSQATYSDYHHKNHVARPLPRGLKRPYTHNRLHLGKQELSVFSISP